MELGAIEKLCLAADALSLNRSDDILAFRILPLFTPFARLPRLSPLREEELDDNRDVEDDRRLGKECSLSTTEFVVLDLALEELIKFGPSISSCGISRGKVKFIFLSIVVFPEDLYFQFGLTTIIGF